MMSGSRPVEPRIGPRMALSALVEEAAVLCTVEVGCTMVSGRPLVVPISTAGGETTVVGFGSGTGSGEEVGCTIDSGRPLVVPT
jgi:hypothetical protein